MLVLKAPVPGHSLGDSLRQQLLASQLQVVVLRVAGVQGVQLGLERRSERPVG